MNDFHLPLGTGIAEIMPIGVMTTARNGINVCCRNYTRVFVLCYQASGNNTTTTTFTFAQSSASAGSATGYGEKALTNNIEEWKYCSSVALTEDGGQDVNWSTGSAAKAWTTAGVASKNEMAIFDVKPDEVMDIQNGFDCLTVNTGNSNSAHYGCVLAFGVPRYKPPLSMTIDNPSDVSWSASASASASESASASAS